MMAQESVPNFKMRKRKCLNLVGLVVLSVVAVSMAQTDVGRAEAQVPGVVQQKPGSVWSLNAQDLLANFRRRREGENDDKKAEAEEKLRINSPRRRQEEEMAKNAAAAANKSSILVKLPENIEEQMNRHKNDRQRYREAILGFPAIYSTSSIENNREIDNDDVDDEDDEDLDEKRPTIASTEKPSTRRSNSNSHPQQTRQNGGEVRQSDSENVVEQIISTTTLTTKSAVTTTPRIATSGLDETSWDVSTKNADKSDDGFSRREPTSSRSVWSIAWEAHVYFSGTLFVLLAIYCSVNILRLHTFSRLFSRGYFVSLNLCLVVIGLLRPIWLFHDPYNANLTWPRYGAYLLVDTGLPCMTTAFAVLFLALLRATMIELVSPSFQTPSSLGIFCGCHFLLSFGVDIAVGLFYHLRYMVLILQGVFIVWSLLLSAGYFYIFSAMNKIAMRQQGDLIRSVYPKLILEGTVTYSESGQIQPLSTSVLKRPPLARAVHLTLGVAILGSLLGGVQLFGMIKMLGLLKEDMSSSQNEWAWYGYQVSMRILEVTLCTLLAVIATTPLRSEFDIGARMAAENGGTMMMDGGLSYHGDMMIDPGSHGHYGRHEIPAAQTSGNCFTRIFCCWRQKSGNLRSGRREKSSCGNSSLCCTLCTDSNPPREFEDEIYSEICSNNHSVRQVMSSLATNETSHHYASTLGRSQTGSNGHPVGTMLPLGTLNTGNHLAIGSNTLLPYKRTHGAANHYPSQSQTLLRSSNNYHDAIHGSGRGGHVQGHPINGNSMTSSRATLDTALYSNVRSRPSSMLFNDSGFVRFRMGNDHQMATTMQVGGGGGNVVVPAGGEMASNQSSQELDRLQDRDHPARSSNKEREGLRASQSFDESVLFLEIGGRRREDKLSPASQPDNMSGLFDLGPPNQIKASSNSPVYNSASDQELRELDPKLGDLDDEGRLHDSDSDSDSEEEEEEEGIYEPAPGTKRAEKKQKDGHGGKAGKNKAEKKISGSEQKSKVTQSQENSQIVPSESDEPIYNGKSLYGRAPSQCSSISATQSFDMRMYGRLQPQQQGSVAQQQKPGAPAFGTLQKSEQKLENPYYYYGSTRNQKKQKQQIGKLQKPRPLLPSQRQALEFANRTPTFTSNDSRPRSQMDSARPSSRQALIPQQHQEILERQQRMQQQQLQQQLQLQQHQLQQHQLQQQQMQMQQQQQQQQQLQQQSNFQRSRSLGHHYQQPPLPAQQLQEQTENFYQQPLFDDRPEPVRNQQVFHHQQQQQQQPGSMTPVSYSRWHHSRQQQQLLSDELQGGGHNFHGPVRRYNPNYDTPPSQRHALLLQQQQQQQQQQSIRALDQLGYMGEIRGVMGTPPIHKGLQKTASQPQQQQQRLRLPTASSVGRQQSHNGSRNGRLLEPVLSPILTDQELSPLHRTHPDYLTDQSESENEEDQATQGYSEGLADNEQDEEESEVSSLFGGQDLENLGSPHLSSYPGIGAGKSKKAGQAMGPGYNGSAGQNLVSPLQYSAMLKLYSTTKDDPPNFSEPKKNELGTRKGSSSSGGPPGNNGLKKKSSFEGKEYARLSTSEKEASGGRIEPETVFSSSPSSAEDSDIPESGPSQKSGSSSVANSAFRWDGTKLGGDRAPSSGDKIDKDVSDKPKSEALKKSESNASQAK